MQLKIFGTEKNNNSYYFDFKVILKTLTENIPTNVDLRKYVISATFALPSPSNLFYDFYSALKKEK